MTRPIRVLHVLDDLETGGTERQLSALLVRSSPSQFQHEVCALAEGGRYADDLNRAGIPVHVLGVAPSNDLLRSLVRLWATVRRVKPDLVHATLYRPGVVSRIVGALSRTKTLTTLVNTTYEPDWLNANPRLNPTKVKLAQMIDTATSSLPGTRFIAVNQTVKDSAVQYLGISPNRISIIRRGLIADPPGMARNGDLTAARSAFGWAKTYPLILNVGRLVAQKGQACAVLAMIDVVKRFPAARLIIAGEGPLESDLRQLIASKGLDEHVTLLGNRDDVPLLLQLADLFVFPSLFEGAANALVEAMAAGKPCVASRIPSLCEVTGDGGNVLFAHPRSPQDFSEKLLRLADDRGLAAAMGEQGRAWVQAQYDMDGSVRQFEMLFRQIIGT